MAHVKVKHPHESQIIEFPTGDDDTLLLSSVLSMFPGVGVTGLLYNFNGSTRAVSFKDGVLYPPHNGWQDTVFHCMFPKNHAKRKADDAFGTELTFSSKKGTNSDGFLASNFPPKKLRSFSSKTEEMRVLLYDFIEKDIPPAARFEASQVCTVAIGFMSAVENEYNSRDNLRDKKRHELECLVIQRAMIEKSEVTYLQRSHVKNIAPMSRVERWQKILSRNCSEISALKDAINAEPSISVANFPDYVSLAHNVLSGRIHDYITVEKKIVLTGLNESSNIVLGWPNAKKAIRLLLKHCFSPSSSPTNSSTTTPVCSVVSKSPLDRKPVHIRFCDEDEEEDETKVNVGRRKKK